MDDNKGSWKTGKDTLSRDWLGNLGGDKTVFRSFSFLWKESLIEGDQNITQPHAQNNEQENKQSLNLRQSGSKGQCRRPPFLPSDHFSFFCKSSYYSICLWWLANYSGKCPFSLCYNWLSIDRREAILQRYYFWRVGPFSPLSLYCKIRMDC